MGMKRKSLFGKMVKAMAFGGQLTPMALVLAAVFGLGAFLGGRFGTGGGLESAAAASESPAQAVAAPIETAACCTIARAQDASFLLDGEAVGGFRELKSRIVARGAGTTYDLTALSAEAETREKVARVVVAQGGTVK